MKKSFLAKFFMALGLMISLSPNGSGSVPRNESDDISTSPSACFERVWNYLAGAVNRHE